MPDKKCPECGNTVSENAKMCPICEVDLTRITPKQQSDSDKKPKQHTDGCKQ